MKSPDSTEFPTKPSKRYCGRGYCDDCGGGTNEPGMGLALWVSPYEPVERRPPTRRCAGCYDVWLESLQYEDVEIILPD